MSHRLFLACLVPLAFAGAATAQIATSNERGATGAYSDDIDSSYTSEGRFGPRTALDDLRAGVDRDREMREKLRQRAARAGAQAAEEDEAAGDETGADMAVETEVIVIDE